MPICSPQSSDLATQGIGMREREYTDMRLQRRTGLGRTSDIGQVALIPNTRPLIPAT